MDDQIETKSLLGSIDLADIVTFSIYGFYILISLVLSKEAFESANKEFKKNESKKNNNLYNLIFEESDF